MGSRHHKAYCSNCNKNLIIDSSKVDHSKSTIRVRCPNCSNIFNYTIPIEEDIVDAKTKSEYLLSKGKSQLKKISKHKDVTFLTKIVVSGISGVIALAIVFVLGHSLGFDSYRLAQVVGLITIIIVYSGMGGEK